MRTNPRLARRLDGGEPGAPAVVAQPVERAELLLAPRRDLRVERAGGDRPTDGLEDQVHQDHADDDGQEGQGQHELNCERHFGCPFLTQTGNEILMI